MTTQATPPPPYWSLETADLLSALDARAEGLDSAAAERRREAVPAPLRRGRQRTLFRLLVGQLTSPITLILIAAAALSFFLHDAVDAAIILLIIGASAGVGAWQESGATHAVERLAARVQVRCTVLRDGRETDLLPEDVVPGDVVVLSAGSIVPGDCRLLDAKDVFAVEAALTGETFPVEKRAAVLLAETPLAQRSNCVFFGTHIVSGFGRAVVVRIGAATEFGAISARLRARPPEAAFERGLRHFGYFLLEITLVLVLAIFAINVVLHRPILESFLFALALAVGLTPQLLPAMLTVNLARGASRMAARRVIVKRLAAIENLGSITVLCSDKTGTLTEGEIALREAVNVAGDADQEVLRLAAVNAGFATGFANPLDEAVRRRQVDLGAWRKLDEVPYDFVRKRVSVLAARGDGVNRLVTKGAVSGMVAVCSTARTADGATVSLEQGRDAIEQRLADLSAAGYRTLGVAYRDLDAATASTGDERDMTFVGFLVFEDRPRASAPATVAALADIGVRLKIITGDNATVATHVARAVGLQAPRCLTGPALRRMSDEALLHAATRVDLFAEVEPNQKERIILALRKSGETVGFLGDGINDASALHMADVGISVDSAVDVAKAAAEFVLLDKDLQAVAAGVEEGRRTFANTLKYVFMTTSANFGNMFSFAAASVLVPFLPMLPKQILLINFLTDLSQLTLADDRVEASQVRGPQHWDMGFIRRFMILFGLQSSVFDFLAFGSLLWVFHAAPDLFRTGWFVESVLSEVLVVFALRARRPAWQSRPSRALLLASVGVAAVTLALPLLPVRAAIGLAWPSWPILLVMPGIVVAYFLSTESLKRVFYGREGRRGA